MEKSITFFFRKRNIIYIPTQKKKKIVITYNINVFDMITCSDKIHI